MAAVTMVPEADGGLFLIVLGVVLAGAPSLKNLCHRAGVPASVGFIVLGLVLGALLRPLDGAASPLFNGAFTALAQLGVVALLFRVGMRSHTSALLAKLPQASLIWVGNVAGSAALGFLASHQLLGWGFETSLVVGTALSATSIAVSMAVWDELGLANSDTGATVLDVAELDDLSAAVLLAVLLGTLPALLGGDGDIWLQIGGSFLVVLAKLALFIAGCYLFAHYLEEHFTAFNRRMSDTPASLTISILGVGLVIAAVADTLGFSVAIGALFAGLAFSRDPEAVRADGRFTYFYEFLTPFFFIHIGMQTDPAVLLGALDVGAVLMVVAVVSKIVFSYLPALLSMPSRPALDLAVSMVPRAEIALVVVFECQMLGGDLVTPEVLAGMVLVTLTTSTFAPIALRRLLDGDVAAARR